MASLMSCQYDVIDVYNDGKIYSLREKGPAGGWIFYENPNWKTDGWRYLEAAPEDSPVLCMWLSTSTWLNTDLATGGTLLSIGSGKNNTAKMLQYKGVRTAPAAEYCDSLVVNGYNDWFLPSSYELNQMDLNLSAYGIGGFSIATYFSSSEMDAGSAAIRNFLSGIPSGTSSKNAPQKIRAVRAF